MSGPFVMRPDRPHECRNRDHWVLHGTARVYRVHSATRSRVGLVTDDHGMAVGRAIALNQGCLMNDGKIDDWTVQLATPNWETT